MLAVHQHRPAIPADKIDGVIRTEPRKWQLEKTRPSGTFVVSLRRSRGSVLVKEAPIWRGKPPFPIENAQETRKISLAGGASGPEIQRSLNLWGQTRAGECDWPPTDALIH